ncbi:MAG: glycerol-3-phosphate 1-O-acyltransferase PlsY [Pseudomonadota bacterium]
MLHFCITIALSYLLGSVSGSLVVGRFFGGVDIRQMGSGNAGGTNALRTQGPLFALMVVIIDVGKGALAAGLLPTAALPGITPAAGAAAAWLPVACAAAAIIGHMVPVWHGFRGGKGGATLVGALAVLAPLALLMVFVMWSLVMMVSGYVGLSTMLSTTAVPAYAAALAPAAPDLPLLAFGLTMVVLVTVAHRGNIHRMREGVESRSATRLLR